MVCVSVRLGDKGVSKQTARVAPLELEPGRRTLVVSDIHGNLRLLRGLLDRAAFSPEDTLIVLGDILERHVDSLETLRYLMELSRRRDVRFLLGNCDNLVIDFVDHGGELLDDFFERWTGRLGLRSCLTRMAQLTGTPLRDRRDYPHAREVFRRAFAPELDFLRAMPHILMNDTYLLVHGGVPREEGLEELDAFSCMKNDHFWEQGYTFQRWVIVGHTPVTLYRGDIASAQPIVDRERHIISIDGGCTLKWDGQLNALILPRTPGEEFGLVSYDGLPTVTALDPQDPSPDPVNIRWGRSGLEVLERGEEFCRCRHLETGRELDILTEYIQRREGRTFCEDATDYRLPVSPGDRLGVVRTTSRGLLAKKDGVTGWYFGATAPEDR